MAGSTSKRVLAVRFDRESVPGFLDPAAFQTPLGIELLSPAGAVSMLPYTEVKALCFVKDFDSIPAWRENRLFTSRPKTEGVWVRFRFRDGDQMDGLLPPNLLLWERDGFMIAPPDPNFLNQRVFIPRAALDEVQVMGVVGSRARQRRAKPVAEEQMKMF